MSQVPEPTIAEIRERVDMVELVGRYVALKRVGKQWRGLCPFHGEKTPSFYVDPTRKGFKCFGCGEWGDSFDFIQKTEGKSFPEALRTIADIVGISIPDRSYRGQSNTENDEVGKRDQAFAINRLAAATYRNFLLSDGKAGLAREYVERRNVSEELSLLFGLGYAPHASEGGWDTLSRALMAEGLSMPLAQELGLVVRSDKTGKYYDRFRGRLMFPILLPGGTCVGFSGRVLPAYEVDDNGEKAAKYINSPESLLYRKSELLFGLHAAHPGIRARGRVILVEGNVDVLALHRAGFPETLAPLGTALTAQQCQRIARLAEVVVLCFDGDRAGLQAAWKAMPLLLEHELDIRIVAIPPDEDPDSVDPERLAAMLAKPQSAFEWLLRRMMASGAMASMEAKAKAVRNFASLIAKVRRADVRSDYIALASRLFEVPIARIMHAIAELDPALGTSAISTAGSSGQASENRGGWGDVGPRSPSTGTASRFSGEYGARSDGPASWPRGDQSQVARGGNSFGRGSGGFSKPGFSGGGSAKQGGDRKWPSDRRGGRWGSGQQNVVPSPPRSASPRHPDEMAANQVMLVGLIVDHPELATLATRADAARFVDDPRLRPILDAVLRAALDGREQPSEGELLAEIDERYHRYLHERVFLGQYLAVEDPKLQLEEALRGCTSTLLEREIANIDRETEVARQTADDDRIRDLQQRKVELRKQQAELRTKHFTL